VTTIALIVAAGSGTRAGLDRPKQYEPIGGKPMLRHAVEAFVRHPRVDRVRVVIGAGQEEQFAAATGGLPAGAPLIGGEARQDSVRLGLRALCSDAPRFVLIHDAARPFCPPEAVHRLLEALEAGDGGAVPGLPATDTLARVESSEVGQAIDRTSLVRLQTPQGFPFPAILDMHERMAGRSFTDDVTLAREGGMNVTVVEGDERLFKLTHPEDFVRAERMLGARMVSRTGMGFDVHAFGGPGPLILGGLTIPHSQGLAGHSDADVVLHTITDALLGAAGEGDIGLHFPPSDERWRGAASDQFLLHAAALIRARGGLIDHVDVTVICEAPKIGPHREAMRARIADILQLPVTRVSVKATTTERLGFTGRGEGIAAQAVATVRMEDA